MPDVIRAFRVTGKVQGVNFRQSTRDEAERLNLRGYACNMSDGSVEVVAGGPVEAVERLRDWLKRGPPHARVSGIEDTAVEDGDELPRAFDVR